MGVNSIAAEKMVHSNLDFEYILSIELRRTDEGCEGYERQEKGFGQVLTLSRLTSVFNINI